MQILLRISLVVITVAASNSLPKLGEPCTKEGAHEKNGIVEVTRTCTKGKWHENGPWLVAETDGAGCKDGESKKIIRKSDLFCQTQRWVLPYAP